MTSLLRLAVFGMVVVFASVAQSADRAGPYIGLRLVGSVAHVSDQSTNGFNGNLNVNQDDDLVGGGGGVFGYRWAGIPFRTEIEIVQRVRFDWGVRDDGPPTVGYENNLESTNILFNILYEYRNKSSFTPFLGGTVGWARNRSDVERTDLATANIESSRHVKHNVAWGVMLGVDWMFAAKWSAEFAYRYIDLGEAGSGQFSGGDEIDANRYSSHDILLSVLYAW